MNRPIRINLYAGPCSGKSTIAAWLFAELKIAGYNIQLIDEYVKRWAYEKRNITGFDEIYIFSKHMFAEESYLRSGALIITDCPLLQTAAYAVRNNDQFSTQLIELSQQFDKKYPSLNIWLNRGNIEYKKDGRYENYDMAIKTDAIICGVMDDYIEYRKFDTINRQEILQYIKGQICV